MVPSDVPDADVVIANEFPHGTSVNRADAIKTHIGDSLNVVIHVERRPGRRFVSEVLEINSYNPDADLFHYCAVFQKEESKP